MPVEPTSDQPVKITITDAPVRVSLSGEQPVRVALTDSPVKVIAPEQPVQITAPVEQVRVIRAGTVIQPIYQGGGVAAMIRFTVDDWIPEGGQYYLDLLHNLESANAVIIRVTVTDSDDTVIAFSKSENYTTNKIRVWIPYEPDMRFAGSVIILGV